MVKTFYITRDVVKTIENTIRYDEEVGWELFGRKLSHDSFEVSKAVVVSLTREEIKNKYAKVFKQMVTLFGGTVDSKVDHLIRTSVYLNEEKLLELKKQMTVEGLIFICEAHSHLKFEDKGLKPFYWFPSVADFYFYLKKNETFCLINKESSLFTKRKFVMRFYTPRESGNFKKTYKKNENSVSGFVKLVNDTIDHSKKVIDECKFPVMPNELLPVGFFEENEDKIIEADEYIKKCYKLDNGVRYFYTAFTYANLYKNFLSSLDIGLGKTIYLKKVIR